MGTLPSVPFLSDLTFVGLSHGTTARCFLDDSSLWGKDQIRNMRPCKAKQMGPGIDLSGTILGHEIHNFILPFFVCRSNQMNTVI